MVHTLYVDRRPGSIYGVMTLQYVKGGQAVEVFKRMPFASGQAGFVQGGPVDDWINSRGGTPYGSHYMSTRKEPLQMTPVGTPFYVMGTERGSRIIRGPQGQTRTNIGVHLENNIPGSAGCIAILHDTPERECLAWAFFTYLDRLNRYEPYIRVVVL